MFHQLVSLVSDGIISSGVYSLEIQVAGNLQRLFANFWVGDQLQHFCLGAFPQSIPLGKGIFEHVGGLLSTLSQNVPMVSAVGFTRQLRSALNDQSPFDNKIVHSATFGVTDLAKSLLGPSVKIFGRFDVFTILDYIIAKLGSAVGQDWLSNYATLRVVSIIIHHFSCC